MFLLAFLCGFISSILIYVCAVEFRLKRLGSGLGWLTAAVISVGLCLWLAVVKPIGESDLYTLRFDDVPTQVCIDIHGNAHGYYSLKIIGTMNGSKVEGDHCWRGANTIVITYPAPTHLGAEAGAASVTP